MKTALPFSFCYACVTMGIIWVFFLFTPGFNESAMWSVEVTTRKDIRFSKSLSIQ
jgi:hypothetical protein